LTEALLMSKFPASFSRGLLFGAALMYFCDPTRGRARRTRVRVLFDHARAKERRFMSRASRDARRRLRGVIQRHRHAPKVDVSDEVLEARLRSALGHAPSHVGDVHLQVRNREVWLRGIVLMREANAKHLAAFQALPTVKVNEIDRALFEAATAPVIEAWRSKPFGEFVARVVGAAGS